MRLELTGREGKGGGCGRKQRSPGPLQDQRPKVTHGDEGRGLTGNSHTAELACWRLPVRPQSPGAGECLVPNLGEEPRFPCLDKTKEYLQSAGEEVDHLGPGRCGHPLLRGHSANEPHQLPPEAAPARLPITLALSHLKYTAALSAFQKGGCPAAPEGPLAGQTAPRYPRAPSGRMFSTPEGSCQRTRNIPDT